MLHPSLTLDFQRADSYCRRTARNSQSIMAQICFSLRGRSYRLLGINNLHYRDGRRYVHFAVSALSRATHHINLRQAAGHVRDQPRKNTVDGGNTRGGGVVLHTLHFKCSGPLWRPGGTSMRSPSTAASAAACAQSRYSWGCGTRRFKRRTWSEENTAASFSSRNSCTSICCDD